MARLIIRAFELLGHEVVVASEMRSFMRSPDMEQEFNALRKEAESEIARIAAQFCGQDEPDLWFTYHPYYKAPDLLGPALSRHFKIPLINAEASYSHRRNIGVWSSSQDLLIDSLKVAAVNLCMTQRDRDGLRSIAPDARMDMLAPFIDSAPYLAASPSPEPMGLITLAMMRPGDKLSSYMALAESLKHIEKVPWRLSIVGDGECRHEVEDAFSAFDPMRIEWMGALGQDEIAALLSRGSVFAWPGHGEAYGLAYLEAQAAGLPVVAEAVAGVPEVVKNERTGLLTPPGDRQAYADALRRLLEDEMLRSQLGHNARSFVSEERSITGAAETLRRILDTYVR